LRPAPAQDRLAERARPLTGFEQAVDHYARAFSAADKQLRQDLPVLETQKQELRTSAERLDQARPGSYELMKSALQYDPETAPAMTKLSCCDPDTHPFAAGVRWLVMRVCAGEAMGATRSVSVVRSVSPIAVRWAA